ncbi:unnamed protein product [Ambrosiozyma monospora]|uniref:Unnamed protein product n=1 Tax=Ambrosiozyma monospora TaxID=43982 RepID=A0ACB5TMG9_AMBMO|nr:unnamed protein product [Ambrosiozyma monospora]
MTNPELSQHQLQHQGQSQQQIDGLSSTNAIAQNQKPLHQEIQNNQLQHLPQETHSQQVQQHIDNQGKQDLQSQIQQQQIRQQQELQQRQHQQRQMQQLEQQQLQYQQAAAHGEEPKRQLYNAPTFLLSQSTGQERPLFHDVPSHLNNSVKYPNGAPKFYENNETQSTSTVAQSMNKTDSGTSLIFQQSAVNLRGMINPSRPSLGVSQQSFKRTEPYNSSSVSKGSMLSALTPLVSAASSSTNNNSNVSKSEISKADDLSSFLISDHTNPETRIQQKLWLKKETLDNLGESANTQENPYASNPATNTAMAKEYANVRIYEDPFMAAIHRASEFLFKFEISSSFGFC